MERYIEQLLADINDATENISGPYIESEQDIFDWIPDIEEDEIAPVRNLEEWTGIRQIQLPAPDLLNDNQIERLLNALIKLLDACNCLFVIQTVIPERFQYAAIRANFNQDAKLKKWHQGFFELCKEGTELGKCALKQYCQCQFFKDHFSDFIEEDLSPEEERARELDIEVSHLKRKYGDDWNKYYPYHLDPEFDDEDGNPYDYGFGSDIDDEEDDDWWRK